MARLTSGDIEALGGALQQRAADLRETIAREAAHTAGEDFADRAGTVTDLGDEAAADVLNDTEHAMHGQHLAELEAVTAAQMRLASGDYGVCVHCGEAIDARRLYASPAAARCIKCQAQQEQAGGASRSHTL